MNMGLSFFDKIISFSFPPALNRTKKAARNARRRAHTPCAPKSPASARCSALTKHPCKKEVKMNVENISQQTSKPRVARIRATLGGDAIKCHNPGGVAHSRVFCASPPGLKHHLSALPRVARIRANLGFDVELLRSL